MNKKITLFMESTKKGPEQTLSEIQSILKKYGIRDMLINYDSDGEIEAVSFALVKDGNKIAYRLPANHKAIWKLAKDGKTKYIKDEKQARRVAWRQILRWIEAQAAVIYTGMVTAEEVFLPYMLLNENKTVYEAFAERKFNIHMLTDGSKKG